MVHQYHTINNNVLIPLSFYLFNYLFLRYTRRSQKLFQSLERAIEMCIQSLPDNLQNNYLDFALFVNELNIKPEVIIFKSYIFTKI